MRRRGVFTLGTLLHHEAVNHLRDFLCLFYSHSTFEETFGLVFAEANAGATPVLAHPPGAAPEVLNVSVQLYDSDGVAEVRN